MFVKHDEKRTFLVAFFKGFTDALNITDISEQIYVQLLKTNLKRWMWTKSTVEAP